MVNLGINSRLEQFHLRAWRRHCRTSREAAAMLPQPHGIPARNPRHRLRHLITASRNHSQLPIDSLRDIHFQFHADPALFHRPLGNHPRQLYLSSQSGINCCQLLQNGRGPSLPEGFQVLR